MLASGRESEMQTHKVCDRCEKQQDKCKDTHRPWKSRFKREKVKTARAKGGEMHVPNFGFEVPKRDGEDSTTDGGPASKDAECKAATALEPMGNYSKHRTEYRSRSKL